MNKDTALQKIHNQIVQIDNVRHLNCQAPDFKKWRRDTEIVIEKIFGIETRHIKDFSRIGYYASNVSFSGVSDYQKQQAFLTGLENARSILLSLVKEIEEFWGDTENSSPEEEKSSPLEVIELLCERFHLVARQLRSRHNDRETLEIEDEYDVQDLFHALLTIYFDDIRDEEWTPSYAGGCSRVDFLLKQENIVIEIKKTRKGLDARSVGEQLLIDIQRYQSHPSCKTLVCFVYDPEWRIANPRGIENDLKQESEEFNVHVYIAPKGI